MFVANDISTQFDRLPPSSVDAEKCMIASMMLDREMIGAVTQIVDREAFYQADHQIIFDVLVKLYAAGGKIDAVILREELIKRQLLDEIGGTENLGSMLGMVPSGAHGEHYAKIVAEKHVLRQLISASNDILRDAYAPHEQAKDVLDKAQARVFAIDQGRQTTGEVSFAESCAEAYDAMSDKGKAGLMTGFFELDGILNGLHDGEMIVVAGRPSMGKTSLALNFIDEIGINKQIPCGIFSLEMTRRELAARMMCSRAGVDMQRARKGFLNKDEYLYFSNALEKCSTAPIFPIDSMNLTAIDFRTRARRMVSKHGVKLIVVDYLQLMSAPDSESRQQGVSEISRTIKCVARELNIPVIAVSQLNRQAETRDGHRPRMSDLRESGSLEQDADVVILLHREDYYRTQEEGFEPNNIAEAIIAKQRNGPTGTIKLTFDSKSTTFKNLSQHSELP